MNRYWSATPAGYFEHVRKNVIIDTIEEAHPALDRSTLDKVPKNEGMDRALQERDLACPKPIRAHSPATHTLTEAIDAE